MPTDLDVVVSTWDAYNNISIIVIPVRMEDATRPKTRWNPSQPLQYPSSQSTDDATALFS